ncbi:MAG TPA: NifB/NifX family molybdenum-iron cluster-binding protein [Phycisphaerae bacterium]|nr:NifB/NifX family molybdenum-iron cluster-binding protein [Phycisphaerae bacterium]
MRIAVTAAAANLDANVDPRFGRCAYFLIVETDTMEAQAVENPNVALGQGAGIQSAQLLAEKGAKFVLTGHCGPNAHETLSAAGIGVILGCTGSVRGAIDRFKAGELSAPGGPDVAGHTGMTGMPVSPAQSAPSAQPSTPGGGGQGRGRGMGRGMGRGQGGGRGGRGGGGGMGQGRGRGRGTGG